MGRPAGIRGQGAGEGGDDAQDAGHFREGGMIDVNMHDERCSTRHWHRTECNCHLSRPSRDLLEAHAENLILRARIKELEGKLK